MFGRPFSHPAPSAFHRMRRGADDYDNDAGIPVPDDRNLDSWSDDVFLAGLPPASQTARTPVARLANDIKYYLRPISDAARRRRRDTAAAAAAPLLADPSNWWYDVDSGHPNEVTDALRQDNPYVGAQLDRAQLMDQVGVPISVTQGSRNAYAGYGYPSVPYGYPQVPYGYPPATYGYPAVSYG